MVTLEEGIDNLGSYIARSEEILAVDEVLSKLERLDPRQARVVELRYFGGLSAPETAEAMAISLSTVEREWSLAKAWLRAQLASVSNS